MLVTTEAVVLRSMKYRDTSKILTLYTREFGKCSALAKGARGAKSKFGSALEPMSHVSAVMYRKEGRTLHLLSHCDVVRPMRSLGEDLEKMAAAMGMMELLGAVSHDEERQPDVFRLLLDSLWAAHNATKRPQNALYFFEVHLLDLLGFRPDVTQCGHCGRELDESAGRTVSLNLGQGRVYCSACAAGGFGVEPSTTSAVRVLRRLQELNDAGASTRITMGVALESDVRGILQRYLQAHVEGMKKLKSEAVFSSLRM